VRSRNILDSFRFAFVGLWYALRTQRNTRIHLSIAAAVVVVGLCLNLSHVEWAVLLTAIVSVVVGLLVLGPPLWKRLCGN
jgi:diacylglycerol kinase (ATP)